MADGDRVGPGNNGADGRASAWSKIESGLRIRDTTALRREVGVVTGLDTQAVITKLGNEEFEEVATLLKQAFVKSSHKPDGPEFVAAFAYALGLEWWETSTDWDAIVKLAGAVDHALQPLMDHDALHRYDVVALYLRRLRSLDHAMKTENALNCSCPIDTKLWASKALRAAEQALTDAAGLSAAPAAHVVQTLASAEITFFEGVITAAEAVKTYIDAPPDAVDLLDVAWGRLCKAERDPDSPLVGDVYESEIRAHRLTVEAMRGGWPRLHVDRAKVVYCYPFALAEMDAGEVLDIVRKHGDSWTLAGMKPTAQRTVRLTDMWDGAAKDEHLHGCESLELQSFTVQTSGDPSPLTDYDVEVRFSRLGNHYLRISRWENDASLHKINQSMRRATDQMGNEKVRFGEEEYDGVAEFATDIIADVGAAIRNDGATSTLGFDSADVHVTVAIRNMSVENADGPPQVATPADLAVVTGGSLLLQPLRQAATSLEEWIRYPIPDLKGINLFGNEGFEGDVAVRTANTTLLFAPGLPDFMLIEYEEMAEFVAALPAVLRCWSSRLQDLTAAGLVDITHIDPKKSGTDAAHDDEQRHLDLRKTMTSARVSLAHIRSASLCLTRAHRSFLDRLFEAAHVPHLEADIEAQFEVANGLYAQLSEHHLHAEEEQRHRFEVRQDLLIGLISLTGVTGLFDLFNAGWQVGDVGKQREFFGFVAFLLPALLVALVIWLRGVCRRRSRRGGRRGN